MTSLYRYDRRLPKNVELPNSPKTTVPLSSSPAIEPLNVRVNGMGSVMDTFLDNAVPTTTPSNISVEVPSAIWLPYNVLPSVLREKSSSPLTQRRRYNEVPITICRHDRILL